jgi:uncharacterized protein YkwD
MFYLALGWTVSPVPSPSVSQTTVTVAAPPRFPGAVVATPADVYATIRARQQGTGATPPVVEPVALAPAVPPAPPAPTSTSVTHPPSSAPTFSASPPSSPTLGQMAAQMVALMNQARTAAGLPPYTVNPVLTQIAMERAAVLASSGQFTHDLPGLGYPLAMEQAAGLNAAGMGAENIAEAGSVAQAFWLLMASPAHRSNILNPYETQVGVGVALLPNGVAVSQLFAGPNF